MSDNIGSYKNWLIHHILLKEIKRCLRLYAKGKLIDIGCGTKPFEKIIEPYVEEHIGLDHEGCIHDKSHIDLEGTAYKIPADDGHFDTVFSTAVLEHLEEPLMALQEAFRTLKNGGFAIYSIPFFWHLHEEPRDFYRFTEHGIKFLFKKAGFEIIELKHLAGFWVTFGQELVYYIWRFKRGWKINPLRLIVPPLSIMIQAICYVLNRFDRSYEYSWMYIVVAKKP